MDLFYHSFLGSYLLGSYLDMSLGDTTSYFVRDGRQPKSAPIRSSISRPSSWTGRRCMVPRTAARPGVGPVPEDCTR